MSGLSIRAAKVHHGRRKERLDEPIKATRGYSLTGSLPITKLTSRGLKETRAPEVLTINGKAEIVIQDTETYQRLIDRLRYMETFAAIQEGMASAERGELKDAAQVLDEMRAKYGLSR